MYDIRVVEFGAGHVPFAPTERRRRPPARDAVSHAPTPIHAQLRHIGGAGVDPSELRQGSPTGLFMGDIKPVIQAKAY